MAKKPELTAIAEVTVTQVAETNTVSSLAVLRDASAEASASNYGANTRYARKLVDVFGVNFWRKASPNFKQWQEERLLYDTKLKAIKHPNPSQAHSRLISAADEICNPKEAGAPRAKVALATRANKEAVALYKAFLKEEEKVGLDDSEKRAFSGLIEYMTKSLKIDLNKLDK